jgi:hypothetical protein
MVEGRIREQWIVEAGWRGEVVLMKDERVRYNTA